MTDIHIPFVFGRSVYELICLRRAGPAQREVDTGQEMKRHGRQVGNSVQPYHGRAGGARCPSTRSRGVLTERSVVGLKSARRCCLPLLAILCLPTKDTVCLSEPEIVVQVMTRDRI